MLVKDYGWVTVGSLLGLSLGSIKNFSQTHSIFEQPPRPEGYDCAEHRRLNPLNSFRERTLMAGLTHGINLFALIPGICFAGCNIACGGSTGLAGRVTSEVYAHILQPLIPTIVSLAIGYQLRRLWIAKSPEGGNLDISGHAISQMALNIQMMHTLQSYADHNHTIQKVAMSIFIGAFSVTDAVFMYHTTAFNHSIADMIIGVALPCFGYLAYDWVSLS